ncbi:MAG TPA: alpha/beta fold hydrolase [Tepidisphaeraceae bacterium]
MYIRILAVYHRWLNMFARAALLRIFFLACVLGACGGSSFARVPTEPFESFTVKTGGDFPAGISAWYLPASGTARGTLFICHGYGSSKERMVGWEWIRSQCGRNVIFFDFREHGQSTHSRHFSTLGFHEQDDLRAVINWADGRGLAKPYNVYGRSMGASTALLEAGADERISGVLAMSPFRNAWLAIDEMRKAGYSSAWAAPLFVHGDLKSILKGVDIPSAVARRDDLRIWIMAGEKDAFPEADQRAILAASKSPQSLKRLVIAPGTGHTDTWRFAGAGALPGHDEYIRQFLGVSEIPTTAGLSRPTVALSAVAVVFAGGWAILLLRRRRQAA